MTQTDVFVDDLAVPIRHVWVLKNAFPKILVQSRKLFVHPKNYIENLAYPILTALHLFVNNSVPPESFNTVSKGKQFRKSVVRNEHGMQHFILMTLNVLKHMRTSTTSSIKSSHKGFGNALQWISARMSQPGDGRRASAKNLPPRFSSRAILTCMCALFPSPSTSKNSMKYQTAGLSASEMAMKESRPTAEPLKPCLQEELGSLEW